MAWKIEYTKKARDELERLGRQTSQRVADYMDRRVAALDNPRDMGQALTGPLGGLWRYRVGDCRVICDIQDQVLRILVVRIGRRGRVYR